MPLIIAGGVLGFITVSVLGVRFPPFFLIFETLSYGKQVRYALIKRRMAWIERERKRRFFFCLFCLFCAASIDCFSQNAAARGC
jgi:hypothetical protein